MKINSVEITQKYINRINSKIYKIIEGTNIGCHETVYAKNKDGYSAIIVNGKRIKVHRLMYQIHHPDEDIDDKLICHTCDNPACVNPEHLFSGTMQDNMTDKVNKDRQARGSKSGMLKLTEEDIIEFIHKTLSGHFTSCKEIAEYYNIHITVIYGIINQQAWKHVTKDFDMIKVKLMLDNRNIIFNEEQVRDIRLRRKNKESLQNIADFYYVSYNTIRDIDVGKTYQYVV